MLKVLFLAARPNTKDALAVRDEVEKIIYRISRTEGRTPIQVISEFATMFEDVPELLRKHRPHILHFSGHGTDARELLFEDRMGKPAPVSVEALLALLATGTARKSIRCVVLNACYGGDAARRIIQHIDFAIGCHAPISDNAALAFAETLYPGLASDDSVQDAFDMARSQFIAKSQPGSTQPELYARSGMDMHAPFFTSVPAAAIPAPPVTAPQEISLQISRDEALLFLNYVERDRALCDEFKIWLSSMATTKALDWWDMSKICAGSNRRMALSEHLERANMILLLLSTDALVDDEWQRLTRRALERHRQDSVHVVPILLRHTLIDDDCVSYQGLQILPRGRGAVASARDRDSLWAEITTTIGKMLPARA